MKFFVVSVAFGGSGVFFLTYANIYCQNSCSTLKPEDGNPTAGWEEWMERMFLICSSARFTVPAFVLSGAIHIKHFDFLLCAWVKDMNAQMTG